MGRSTGIITKMLAVAVTATGLLMGAATSQAADCSDPFYADSAECTGTTSGASTSEVCMPGNVAGTWMSKVQPITQVDKMVGEIITGLEGAIKERKGETLTTEEGNLKGPFVVKNFGGVDAKQEQLLAEFKTSRAKIFEFIKEIAAIDDTKCRNCALINDFNMILYALQAVKESGIYEYASAGSLQYFSGSAYNTQPGNSWDIQALSQAALESPEVGKLRAELKPLLCSYATEPYGGNQYANRQGFARKMQEHLNRSLALRIQPTLSSSAAIKALPAKQGWLIDAGKPDRIDSINIAANRAKCLETDYFRTPDEVRSMRSDKAPKLADGSKGYKICE